jgi:drug/metabolite transporter (DMT)-like permease
MKVLNKKATETLLISKSILSALFPVLTIIAYKNSMSPLTTLAWSYLVAMIFFAVSITIRKDWKNNITKTSALKDVTLSVLFIGVIFHFLFFLALEFTSAPNVSLLSLLEVVFGFIIIGWITGKEPISGLHIFGALLMLLSASIILFNGITAFNIGDIIIIIAVAVAPVGNIFAKRALHQVSLLYLLFMRSLAGVVIFFIAAYFFEGSVGVNVAMRSIPYLLFSGLMYFGIMKIATMVGFRNLSVTHTTALRSLKPVFTFIFAWILLRQIPTNIQIIAIVPSLIGLYLITKAKQKQTNYGVENNN